MGKVDARGDRINWIDMARGYGIILVIIGHIMPFGAKWDHLLSNEIYSFHMPLFFIISGFLFSAMKYSPKEFVLKRVKGLMLPYLWIGLVIIAVNWLFYNLGNWSAIGGYIKALIIQNRFHVIWYLTCLFLSELAFYAIVRLLKDQLWQIGIISTMLGAMGIAYYISGGGPLPWNIDICPTAIFFIFLGYAAKKVGVKADIKLMVAAVIANLVCVAINEIVVGHNLEMFGRQYAIVPLTVLGSAAGVYFIYWISQWKQCAPIEYIGKHSLIYFGLHQAVTLPGCEMLFGALGWFPNKQNIVQGLGYILVTTLISLGFLTLVHKLVLLIRSLFKHNRNR